MSSPILPRVLALSSLVFAVAASASPIIGFDLSSQPSAAVAALAPSTLAPGLVGSDLVRGPGLASTNLIRGVSANEWTNDFDGATLLPPTRENAIAQGDYFQFGFAVLPGFSASLDTLDVSLRRSGLGAPTLFEWQYSLDGFATAGVTVTQFEYLGRASEVGSTGATSVAENFNYMTEDVALQGEGNAMPTVALWGIAELQNLPGGTEVLFRLYGWGADRNSRTVALGRNDGPFIGGTVIPEPHTYALLVGLAGLGVAIVRRRRVR